MVNDGEGNPLDENQQWHDAGAVPLSSAIPVDHDLLRRAEQQSREVLSAIQVSVMEKLRQREIHILLVEKENLLLRQRIENLYEANKFWKEVAHQSEDKVNSLRAQISDDHRQHSGAAAAAAAAADDAESAGASNQVDGRLCNQCYLIEPTVLVLPCRHLSLCEACVSNALICPRCHFPVSEIIHLNLS